MKSKTAHKRVKSISSIGVQSSRYAHIPTENLKFKSFVDALYSTSAKLTTEDIKSELVAYV